MEDHEIIGFLRRKRDWEKKAERYRRRHLRMLGWVLVCAIPIWAAITALLWMKFC